MRIAIIGAGISGLLTARLLESDHDVHVFEADGRAGGHANTVPFDVFGRRYAADAGFVVFNDRAYPNFSAMLRRLGVPGRRADMSVSVRSDRSGLEYRTGSLNGLFAQRRNLGRPPFRRMVFDLWRFDRQARSFLRRPDERVTLGEYLERNRYGREFVDDCLVPVSVALWSADPGRLLQSPARPIMAAFADFGLAGRRRPPRWQTVEGGAARYVKALARPFAYRIRLNTPVRAVRRTAAWVIVEPERGVAEHFDTVVLATHADQALAVLPDARDAEREILSAFPYRKVEAILHLDPAVLRRTMRARASWNCRVPAQPDRPAVLTWSLNRLQGLRSSTPIGLTLNDAGDVDERTILQRIEYRHPVGGAAALAARQRFHEINGQNRTYFCGAYWGSGLHEDGVTSALAVAQCFDKQPGW